MFYFYWGRRRINKTGFQFALHCIHTYPHTHIHTYTHLKYPNKKQKNQESKTKRPSNCTNTSYFVQKNRSWEEVQNAKLMTKKCWTNSIINIQNIYITELVTVDVLRVCKTLEPHSWFVKSSPCQLPKIRKDLS